jgi:Mce-associated membrane protein
MPRLRPARFATRTTADAADLSGASRPGSGDDAASSARDEPPGRTPRPGRSSRLAAGLCAAAVVLAAFGFWARTEAGNYAGGTGSSANAALTDRATTGQVRSKVTAAVNTIFSYRYTDTAATSAAAQQVLTGPAVRQYNQLFALVRKEEPAARLILTTRVTNAGVELLDGNRARVLIFANQQDTVAGTHKTSYAGAMFAVIVVRVGGAWKIENIDTFS